MVEAVVGSLYGPAQLIEALNLKSEPMPSRLFSFGLLLTLVFNGIHIFKDEKVRSFKYLLHPHSTRG